MAKRLPVCQKCGNRARYRYQVVAGVADFFCGRCIGWLRDSPNTKAIPDDNKRGSE